MHTILGAGGTIGTLLLQELNAKGFPLRLVSRKGTSGEVGNETMAADITDRQQTIDAVAGSSIVYLVIGLEYRYAIWREQWPKIMGNAIEACKQAHAKLLFFDNVYMYGKVNGPMTEETPFNPISRKGELRATIVSTLLDEIRKGDLTALVARAADFYGPYAKTAVPNILIFDKFAKGGRASLLGNDKVRHSYTFTPDAARALVTLTGSDAAWNQTWHLPTAPDPPTGREFVRMVGKEFGVDPRYNILRKWMLQAGGLFDPTIRELPEMLYQSRYEYLFDSSKYTNAFGVKATSYEDGIRETIAAYGKSLGGPAR